MPSLLLDSRTILFKIQPGGLGMRIDGDQITNFDQLCCVISRVNDKI